MQGLERLERRELLTVADFTDRGWAVAVHTSAEGVDSLFVSGTYHQSVDMDPSAGEYWLAPVEEGGFGAFLARYTQEGTLVWAKSQGSLGRSVVIQGDSLYVATGQAITKHDLNGNVLWSTPTNRLGNIAVDADGSVYSTGTTNWDGISTDINPGQPGTAVLAGGTYQDAYLAKWDANGTYQWHRRLGGAGSTWTADVEVKDGVIYFAGKFAGTLDADDVSTTNPILTNQKIDSASTHSDGFVAQFSTVDGAFLTVSQFVDAYLLSSVAIEGDQVFVGGGHGYAVDLDPGAGQYVVPTPLNEAGFVVKLTRGADGTLAFVSAKSLGTATDATVASLAVRDGALYVGGQFFGKTTRTNFGTINGQAQSLLPAGTWDAYLMSVPVANVTNEGLNWVRQLGSSTYGNESWNSVAVGAAGVYGAGITMAGTGTFGSLPVPNGGETDAFFARVSTSGTPDWLFGIGSVVRTIDNGTTGYTDAGGWTNLNVGYAGSARTHRKGTGSAVATWNFTGLPNGTYEVQVRWPASSKNATNAPYSVNGGSSILVNQTQTPVGDWLSLGTYTITNGTLTVRLTDKANNNVVADAARIVFLTPPAPSAALLAATSGDTTETSSWDSLTLG